MGLAQSLILSSNCFCAFLNFGVVPLAIEVWTYYAICAIAVKEDKLEDNSSMYPIAQIPQLIGATASVL